MRRARGAIVLVACLGAAGCAALSGLDSLEVGDVCGDDACDDATTEASADVASGSGDGATTHADGASDGPASSDAIDTSDTNDATAPGDDEAGDGSSPDANDANEPIDASDGGDATATDAGLDAPIDARPDAGPDAACPGTGGPVGVRVPMGFCVDATEVTVAQYAQFLTAKGNDTSGQPAYCSWNASYQPSFKQGASNTPANYVDWCDAYAFCAWAGKRLCGGLGGGSSPFASFASAQSSQWFAACSANGTVTYPYGNTYDGSACAGKDSHASGVTTVASYAGCVGGYPGVYDMSGNALEWEDSCDGTSGGSDNCRLRGGAYYSTQSQLACSEGLYDVRNGAFYDTTIRCCSP